MEIVASEAPARCDTVLRDGVVVDGTGAPGFRADVALAGDTIVGLGALGRMVAECEIDAGGFVVAPGFIDVHTHDDNALLCQPDMSAKASQGVTTVIAGNCGISLAPLARAIWPLEHHLLGDGRGERFAEFGAYVERLGADPPALNAALLVGHLSLRHAALPDLARPANDAEIGHMQTGVAEAMAAGAIGLSTGLDYPGAVHSSTEEVLALARTAAEAGGLYASHTRNYFETVLEALDEALEIGRAAPAELVISHHQVSGAANYGKSARSLAMIEAAAAEHPVGFDVYPYAASSKVLDPARAEPGVRILITWSEPHPNFAGSELDAIAADMGCPAIEAAERLLPAGAVYFQLDEADVDAIVTHPASMIGSDGLPHDVFPHPRLWGTFPRVLGHYVRARGLLSLEAAVHKMTGLSAATFGLAGRGAIAPGMAADLVVFDAGTIAERATFLDPIQPAAGIERVIVGGETVWRGGAPTGARPGRVLRRQAGAGAAP